MFKHTRNLITLHSNILKQLRLITLKKENGNKVKSVQNIESGGHLLL